MINGQCDKCKSFINRNNSVGIQLVENGQIVSKDLCANCVQIYNEYILKFFEQEKKE